MQPSISIHPSTRFLTHGLPRLAFIVIFVSVVLTSKLGFCDFVKMGGFGGCLNNLGLEWVAITPMLFLEKMFFFGNRYGNMLKNV